MRRLRTFTLHVLCTCVFASTAAAQQPPPPFSGVPENESRPYDDGWAYGNTEVGSESISDDGRFVAFASSVPTIVPGDTNGFMDVFLRDRLTRQTVRVSVNTGNDQANWDSDMAAVSGDGRHVAFRSLATNLVPGDGNGHMDFFVRDVIAGTTVLVSVGPAGEPLAASATDPLSISQDGRYIAFIGTFGFWPNGYQRRQVWLRDRDADGNGIFDEPGSSTTTLISRNVYGAESQGWPNGVSMSDDARWVAFASDASDLPHAPQYVYGGGVVQAVYAHDRLSDQTVRVDVTAVAQPDGVWLSSWDPKLSADGRYLLYASDLVGLVDNDLDVDRDVFVFDLFAGGNRQLAVTVPETGASFNYLYGTSISGDGSRVGFVGNEGFGFNRYRGFVHDLNTGGLYEVGVPQPGSYLGSGVYTVGVSADGTAAVFVSNETIVPDSFQSAVYVAVPFAVSTHELEVSSNGGTYTFAVQAPANTTWTARSWNPRIAFTQGTGTGDGLVEFTIGPHDWYEDYPSIFVGSEVIRIAQRHVPTVTNAGPLVGPVTGGAELYVYGDHFMPGATVKFGSVEAPTVEVLSPTVIRAVTPPSGDGRAGETFVYVTNPDGGTAQAFVYFYEDATPPVVEPVITGTLGRNGWYTSDVTVSWTVTDPESDLEMTCPAWTITEDSAGYPVPCTARSGGGESATFVEIKRDATPPLLLIDSPRQGATYARGEEVVAFYYCTDGSEWAASGLTRCEGTVPMGSQVNTSQAGTFTISAAAEDVAGHVSLATVTYSIAKSIPMIEWSPATLNSRLPLGPAQLNPAADTAGTFSFVPAAGTMLPPGMHELVAMFTPADASNFGSVTVTAFVEVVEGDAPVRWGGVAADESRTYDGSITSSYDGTAAVTNQALSADGRFVAFESTKARVVFGDLNGTSDVFVRDRVTRQVTRVSVSSNSVAANGSSKHARLSADGRHVGFVSCASNLVAADANGKCDIFVRDRQQNRTTRISVGPNEEEALGNAADHFGISATGRYVAFISTFTYVDANFQLWIRDRDVDADGMFDEPWPSSATTLISPSVGPMGYPTSVTISGDGRWLAFTAWNYPSTYAPAHLYLHDVQAGVTTRVDAAAAGFPETVDTNTSLPDLDANGRILTYSALRGGTASVYVFDRTTGQNARLEAPFGSTASGLGEVGSSVSDDGRLVAYAAYDGYGWNSFVADRDAGVTHLVIPGADGLPRHNSGLRAAISGEGTAVAFSAGGALLAMPGDATGVFVALDFMVSPDAYGANPEGDTSEVFVDAPANTSWTAKSTAPSWLVIESPAAGTGGAMLRFTVAANSSGLTRVGYIHVGSEVVAVSQPTGSIGNKQVPVITWNNPANIVYGVPLYSLQLNATANVPGTFTYSPASGTYLPAGTHTLSVTFVPTDTTNYAGTIKTATIVVDKARPAITWPAPAAIPLRWPLGAEQLNATANFAGTLTYDPPVGTRLDAGSYTLTAAFAPADPANVEPATASVTLNVLKADPVLRWETPAPMGYGPLGPAQLNATAIVPGTITYNPPSGTVLEIGQHVLWASIVPDDPNYDTASYYVFLQVVRGTPVLTWPEPAPVVYGQALGASRLNVTANVPGSFSYTVPNPLNAGVRTLSVLFSPQDSARYDSVSKSVAVTVLKATPTIVWQPATIDYGTPLGTSHLNASANVAGTFSYSIPAGTVLSAGTHPVHVTLTPADTGNYETASASVTLTVAQATPAITWPGPEPIAYGAALDGTQLNATASVPGIFSYSPPAGTVLGAGTHTLNVTFTPDDAANYESASATVALTVAKASTNVSWANPSSITYGAILNGAQLNATANVPGTFTYSPAPLTALPAGTHVLSVTFAPADGANYLASDATVTLTVAKAPLTIVANNASKVYGEGLPAFTAWGTEFVNGDTIASLSGTLSFSTAATATSAPGTYAVVPGGLSSPNYNVSFAAGTLTVNKASTAMMLTTSPSPSQHNKSVQVRAEVGAVSPGAGIATGTVEFRDNGVLLGTAPLVNGVATLSVTMRRGTHPLTATYAGDANFTGSTGARNHQTN